MIVLDEQLLGRQLDSTIAHWYRGHVVYITDLRPTTVIKDDAIPVLLRQSPQPTFVTINATDFWQRIPPEPYFCIVCCALSDPQVPLIPLLLRQLLHHPRIRTKAQRMGMMIRLSKRGAVYYTSRDSTIQDISF